MTTIAILGLGEAGGLYARGLSAAGADVRGYDPFLRLDAEGVAQVDAVADAVAGADAVLSLVGGRASAEAAGQAIPALDPGTVYADLNTAAPETKAEIAEVASARGVPMVDVAVLAPVPRAGHRTELLASGTGAEKLAALLAPFEVPIVVIDGGPGAAARLKLLRSVFMKGLAALVLEGVGAARAAGAEDWLRAQVAQELGPDGAALVDRLITGTYAHAQRRELEVREALAALEAAGSPADMTRATLTWFERVLAEGRTPPGRAD